MSNTTPLMADFADGQTHSVTEDLASVEGRRLFTEISQGRAEAFGELYDLVARRLYGLAVWRTGSPAEAEDVVQEVFIKVAQKRLELTSIHNPVGWLLTVTHRTAVDATRRRRVRKTEPLELAVDLESTDLGPERAIEAQRASRLLSRLPAAQREVIYLRLFVGESFADIAAITGVPTFTAASRYRRGLSKLRRFIDRGDIE